LRHPPSNFEVSQEEARSIINIEQFIKKLEEYLKIDSKFDTQLANKFIDELILIQSAVRSSKLFLDYEMVGTSFLFIHHNGNATIRWIDFANTYKPSSDDNNGIQQGIDSLINILSELIKAHI